MKNSVDFWHRKLTLKVQFGTLWWTIIHHRIVFKQFPLSMSILGQKSCILGPTIFKIPQPNWHWIMQVTVKDLIKVCDFIRSQASISLNIFIDKKCSTFLKTILSKDLIVYKLSFKTHVYLLQFMKFKKQFIISWAIVIIPT